jgi:dienelactone hydrolase
MLKKIISILLGGILSISLLASCADTNTGKEKNDTADHENKINISKKYAGEMAAGKFDNTVNAFDKTMAAALTQEQLKQVWSDTTKSIGEYRGIYSAEYSDAGNDTGYQVTVILEYEERALKVFFSYDNGDKINGLYLNYFNIPTASDDLATNVKIEIGEGPHKLDGILRLPEGIANPPVVIMIQGSGQSDFDETIGPNKPFKDIAEGLAEKGIASVRYNKRYYQYPETAPKNITIDDEVINDVSYAIEFVKNREAIKNSNIYILGHSLGGMLAPFIASINPGLSGIIIMAGSPRGLEDIILDQNAAAIKAMDDKNETEKEQLLEMIEKEIGKIKALKKGDKETMFLGIPSSYWLSLNRIDTVEISKSLSIPMLILQGKADFQVSADTDYKMWQEIFKEKTNVSFKLYENLNHLFMPTNGLTDASEYDTKSTVDAEVISDIAQWIANNPA